VRDFSCKNASDRSIRVKKTLARFIASSTSILWMIRLSQYQDSFQDVIMKREMATEDWNAGCNSLSRSAKPPPVWSLNKILAVIEQLRNSRKWVVGSTAPNISPCNRIIFSQFRTKATQQYKLLNKSTCLIISSWFFKSKVSKTPK